MNGIKSQITYWHTSAVRDWKTAQGLYQLKRYDACLFFCHLALEKVLKAIVTQKTGKPAPYLHDLVALADRAQIDLSPQHRDGLAIFTTFHISGRYDDEKFSFYKRCTKSFTTNHLNGAKELYLWLKKEFRNT